MAKPNPITSMLDKAFGVGGIKPKIAVKIAGEHEAIRALGDLPQKVALRVMRAAIKKSQAPGLAAARQAAIRIWNPHNNGVHLADTVIDKIKAYKNNMTIYGLVGFTGGASWLVEHGHRLVKGGTVTRINKLRTDYGRAGKAKEEKRTAKGAVIGKVPPHPFMAPAMQKVIGTMQAIFISEVEKGTARAIKQIAKEAGVK